MFGKRKGGSVDEVPTLHPRTPMNQTIGSTLAENQSAHREVRWWMQVQIGTYTIRALYDPGASTTVMGPLGLQLATACGREFVPTDGKSAILADGRISPVAGYVYLPMELGGVCEEVRVAILMDLESTCYVGVNFCKKFRLVHDAEEDHVLLKANGNIIPLELAAVKVDGQPELASVGLNELTDAEEKQLQAMLDRVLGQIPQSSKLKYTQLLEHEIDVGDARPIKQRSYNYSPEVEEAMHEQVRELLAADIIENASGGWANPVVMVKKPNGKYRLCIDFRKVNKIPPKTFPIEIGR